MKSKLRPAQQEAIRNYWNKLAEAYRFLSCAAAESISELPEIEKWKKRMNLIFKDMDKLLH